MSIDAGMLSGVKSVENSLRERAQGDKRKEMGVLADLPVGHPMLKVFEEAKKKYEERMAGEEKEGDAKHKRKEKKKGKKAKIKREAEKELETIKKRASMKSVNQKIDDAQSIINELLNESKSAQEIFKNHPTSSTRLKRLERTIMAFSRGLSDSKMTTISFEDERHGG